MKAVMVNRNQSMRTTRMMLSSFPIATTVSIFWTNLPMNDFILHISLDIHLVFTHVSYAIGVSICVSDSGLN